MQLGCHEFRINRALMMTYCLEEFLLRSTGAGLNPIHRLYLQDMAGVKSMLFFTTMHNNKKN
jgi:hypothetical protein